MRVWLTAIAMAWLCAACAQTGASGATGPGTGSITMYGTIDQGVTFRK